jgi:dienelactone hydrolase
MLSRALCLLSAGLLMAQTGADPAATARKALDALIVGNYSDYSGMASPSYKSNLNEEAFGKMASEIKGWGAMEKVGDPAIQKMGPATLVTFPVTFASRNTNFRFAVNASSEIAAMYLMPAEVPWQRPSYSKPDSFTERNVTFGEDPWKLPGTLAAPKGSGPFPAVLLVAGFGPKDRDDTNLVIKPFHDISDGLASRGVVVLRYDKRSRRYAAQMGGRPYTADDETVDDAVAALAFLRSQPEVDPKRVYLFGHDFGGYLAPRIAADDTKLAGMIIADANERPLEDLMLDQVQMLGVTGKNLESAKAAVARVKALEHADADAPEVLGLPVAFWLNLKSYDPLAEAKKLNIPILILYGDRDAQVPVTDFNLWKSGLSGQKDVTAKLYPTLDHLYLAGTGKSTEEDYRKPGHVAPEVIDDLARFVGK